MAEKTPATLGNRSEAPMYEIAAPSYLEEMRGRVADVMRRLGGWSQKERINRAANWIGLTPRRTAGIFYEEARQIDVATGDLIRQRSELLRQKMARLDAEYEALRADLVAQAPRGLARLCPPPLEPLESPQNPVASKRRAS